jgi:hypothetical protein
MKQFWLLAFVFVFLNWLGAQEVKHAPTVARCRADQKLWLAKLEQSPMRSGVADVGYNELIGWKNEMQDCLNADPDLESGYYNTFAEASEEELMRFQNFLERHHLSQQFLAEDDQGKR